MRIHRYRDEVTDPKLNAQRNLAGRTFYAEEQTLKYFHAKILSCKVVADGLLLAMVESIAANAENTERGFRHVVFDVFGTVHSRVNLDHLCKTRKQAEKVLAEQLATLDAVALTREAIAYHRQSVERQLVELEQTLPPIPGAKAPCHPTHIRPGEGVEEELKRVGLGDRIVWDGATYILTAFGGRPFFVNLANGQTVTRSQILEQMTRDAQRAEVEAARAGKGK
jgi:hypothetical protein